MKYKLFRYQNYVGHGVALVRYDADDELVDGFVLATFDTAEEADKYANQFIGYCSPELSITWLSKKVFRWIRPPMPD